MNCQYKTYCGECERNPITCRYFQTLVNLEDRGVIDREIPDDELIKRIINDEEWWVV